MQSTRAADLESIRHRLKEKGYGIISDWELKDLASKAREEYLDSMAKYETSPPRQGFHYSDLVHKPHRKLAIGSRNGDGEKYPQLLQTTYFSKDHSKYENLGKIFSYLISLRNRILGMDEGFGNDPEQDGFWNACRIHHYPAGGGFMFEHRDTLFPKLLEESGCPFLQVLVVLSTRGKDFHTGGGFVDDRDGNRIFYENENSLGNIVFFDGSIVHGVDDVDGDKVMNFSSQAGRVAGFVGSYKVLS